MTVLDRYLLRRATHSMLGALAVVWPFLLLASLDKSLSRNALIALRPLETLIIALISSAPIAFALAAGGGSAWFAAWVQRQDTVVALGAAWRSPTSALRWVVVPALGISVATFAVLEDALPRAVAWVDEAEWIEERDLGHALERLTSFGEDELVATCRLQPDGALEDLFAAIALENTTVGVAAQLATATLGDARSLALQLSRGGIDIDPSDRMRRIRFESARLELGLGFWLPRSPWRRPTARHWSDLPGDERFAQGVVGETNRRIQRRFVFERPFRVAVAFMPLLLSLQVAFGMRRRLLARRQQALLTFCSVVFVSAMLLATGKSLATAPTVWPYVFLGLSACVPACITALLVRLVARAR